MILLAFWPFLWLLLLARTTSFKTCLSQMPSKTALSLIPQNWEKRLRHFPVKKKYKPMPLPHDFDDALMFGRVHNKELQLMVDHIDEGFTLRNDDKLFDMIMKTDFTVQTPTNMGSLLELIAGTPFLKTTTNPGYRVAYTRIFDAMFNRVGMSQMEVVFGLKSFYRCRYRVQQTDNIDGLLNYVRLYAYKLNNEKEFPGFFAFLASLGIQYDWLPKDVAVLLADKAISCTHEMLIRDTAGMVQDLGRMKFSRSKVQEAVITMAERVLREGSVDLSRKFQEEDLGNMVRGVLEGLAALGIQSEMMSPKLRDYIMRSLRVLLIRIPPVHFAHCMQNMGKLQFSWYRLPEDVQQLILQKEELFLPGQKTFSFQMTLEGLSKMGLELEDLPEAVQARIATMANIFKEEH